MRDFKHFERFLSGKLRDILEKSRLRTLRELIWVIEVQSDEKSVSRETSRPGKSIVSLFNDVRYASPEAKKAIEFVCA